RGLDQIAVHRQPDDRKRVREREQRERRERISKRAVEAARMAPVERRAAAAATQHTVERQRPLALQQVALVAGDHVRATGGIDVFRAACGVHLTFSTGASPGAGGAPERDDCCVVIFSASTTQPPPIALYSDTYDVSTACSVCVRLSSALKRLRSAS